MILLSPVADSPDLIDAVCPTCQTSVHIPCVLTVNTDETLESLLAGTLNTVSCPSCGTCVSAVSPVTLEMPQLGIGTLFYTPFSYLRHDFVREGLAESECQNLIFYSLDELSRQVQARIWVSEFQNASSLTNLTT